MSGLAFGFALPEPNFGSTCATYQQVEEFRQQFQGLVASQAQEAAPTPHYVAATERSRPIG